MKYKSLEDGRRQIINYAFPADLLGLQGAAFGKIQHSVEALSAVTLCIFDINKLWSRCTRRIPALASMSRGLRRTRNPLVDLVVTVGQRTAIHCIAFVLLNLYRRAKRSSIGGAQHHAPAADATRLYHRRQVDAYQSQLSRVRRLNAFGWQGAMVTMYDENALVEFTIIAPGIDGVRRFS